MDGASGKIHGQVNRIGALERCRRMKPRAGMIDREDGSGTTAMGEFGESLLETRPGPILSDGLEEVGALGPGGIAVNGGIGIQVGGKRVSVGQGRCTGL